MALTPPSTEFSIGTSAKVDLAVAHRLQRLPDGRVRHGRVRHVGPVEHVGKGQQGLMGEGTRGPEVAVAGWAQVGHRLRLPARTR